MCTAKKDLYSFGNHRTYKSDANETFFLLGGVGAGNISIGPRGQLAHWEIFNRPNKNTILNNTFFSIYAKAKDEPPVVKVLESAYQPPYTGKNLGAVPGLPRLTSSTMRTEFPYAWIDFTDDALPVAVSLEAFTPFIPLNPEDSGLPCAILTYTVKNTSDAEVDVTIAASLLNAVGLCDMDRFDWKPDHDQGKNVNVIKQNEIEQRESKQSESEYQGASSSLYMYSENYEPHHFKYGSLCLSVPETDITAKPYWYEGGWFDNIQDFWHDFATDGLLDAQSAPGGLDSDFTRSKPVPPKIGSLGVPVVLPPGGEKRFVFVLSWHFPNRVKAWDFNKAVDDTTPLIRNHYALRFTDAYAVGQYVLRDMGRLHRASMLFHDALYHSTLPDYVIESLASSIAVLRSPTVMWLETGHMAAWEGCYDTHGSCFGTSTHVWNYAQTLAFLFPSLERSAREIEFLQEVDEEGRMAFRTNTVFGLARWDYDAAADGQLGTIIRLYREWKLSGDNDFLVKMWSGAKRAMDYTIQRWDPDQDGVLSGKQHNTYDIELYGISAMPNGMFYAALKACAEMATAMGDTATAADYLRRFEIGHIRMDTLLWNGEYYRQQIDDLDDDRVNDLDAYKYQYGEGCLTDQLFGQMLAHVCGLGYILPAEHVKDALKAIYRYNFLPNQRHHHNAHRSYALQDEAGVVICTWPKGGKPRFPVVYCDEVWTGIEYQLAAHLIYEGFVEEGLSIVRAVRDRYDGYKRNPWDEMESGHHYARSMSAWAVLTALSGFQCDMVNRTMVFAPKLKLMADAVPDLAPDLAPGRVHNSFCSFWSTGTAWGIFNLRRDGETGKYHADVQVLYGTLDDVQVKVLYGTLDDVQVKVLYGTFDDVHVTVHKPGQV